jgi:hypothetical protein
LRVCIQMIERHLSNRSNVINHPSVLIEHSIEVVISHLIFYGLFIILSTIHPRQMIGHNILHPFLSLISTSNSWRRRIQRIKRGLASFLAKRYLMTAWSV